MRRNDITGLQCLALIFLALVVITGARVAWDRWTRPGPLEWEYQEPPRNPRELPSDPRELTRNP